MNAEEFIKSKYEEGQIAKWKPEMVEAMSQFMEAYAKHKTEALEFDLYVEKEAMKINSNTILRLLQEVERLKNKAKHEYEKANEENDVRNHYTVRNFGAAKAGVIEEIFGEQALKE